MAGYSLSQEGGTHTPAQHNKLLELLLCLANLQEYLRHHSVEVKRADGRPCALKSPSLPT
jgi:hypothetical protein